MPNKPKTIDLFSGAGGLSLGFHQAGCKPLLANDFDEDAAETFRHNFSDVPFLVAPIQDLSGETRRDRGGHVDKIDFT